MFSTFVFGLLIGICVSLPNNFELDKKGIKGSVKRDGGCASGELACNDGSCYNADYQCDSWPDCSKGEDDLGCSPCTADQYKCGNDNCIYKGFICDGDDDCGDGTDERGCQNFGCGTDQFRCIDNECIPMTYVCDSWPDCVLAEDDIGCLPCEWYEFLCGNGNCVPFWWLCDGDNDCGDSTDEVACSGRKRGLESATKREEQKYLKESTLKRKKNGDKRGVEKIARLGKQTTRGGKPTVKRSELKRKVIKELARK